MVAYLPSCSGSEIDSDVGTANSLSQSWLVSAVSMAWQNIQLHLVPKAAILICNPNMDWPVDSDSASLGFLHCKSTVRHENAWKRIFQNNGRIHPPGELGSVKPSEAQTGEKGIEVEKEILAETLLIE